MVKKTRQVKCHNCKGTGIVELCGKCGRQIYKYKDGEPFCDYCDI